MPLAADTPDALQRTLAAEMAQPNPVWPPRLLDVVGRRMGPKEVDNVRMMVAWSAALTVMIRR